jgi:Zn finger protein HypA/HybF involved in hydrogenase expression
MKVTLCGWAIFECEDCGGQFAAMVIPGQKIYCPNCGKLDTVPEDIQLAAGITLTEKNDNGK